jgi:hypothetical protein
MTLPGDQPSATIHRADAGHLCESINCELFADVRLTEYGETTWYRCFTHWPLARDALTANSYNLEYDNGVKEWLENFSDWHL